MDATYRSPLNIPGASDGRRFFPDQRGAGKIFRGMAGAGAYSCRRERGIASRGCRKHFTVEWRKTGMYYREKGKAACADGGRFYAKNTAVHFAQARLFTVNSDA